MKESRTKLIIRYVLPTILSQCAFFLFTIIDGIFVGHGVGTDGLGAVNISQPLVMIIGAVFMLTTIGGVTITAIRIGRKDYEGANLAFMHAMASTVVVAAFFTVIGTLFTKPLAILLGANDHYVKMVSDYLFWYTLFTIPSALSAYLYSTKRTKEAVIVNILRGLIFTPLCVVALSFLTNDAILWFTVGIAEAATFVSAATITKRSESGRVQFEKD